MKVNHKFYFSSRSWTIQSFYHICLHVFYWLQGYRLHVMGKTSVQTGGPYVFACNHRSLNDPPILAMSLVKPLAFIAKQELFEHPLMNLLLGLVSTISINREKPEASTMKLAKKALTKKDWDVGIFIEGTRSKDEKYLAQPNSGPVFIAKLAKAQIVPVGISYRGKDIYINFGDAYSIDPKADMDDQAWDCLERISKLCDYELPERI